MQIAQNKFLRYSAAAGIALALCFGAGECGNFALPSLSVEVSAAEVVDSGSCGYSSTYDNVTYILDSDGVLTISGSGSMKNYDFSDYNYYGEYSFETNVPWNSYRSQIKTVIINDGVSGIGQNAFRYLTNLTSVTIHSSLRGGIGYNAFDSCTNLTTIVFSKDDMLSGGWSSSTGIESYAFYGCTSLTEINIPDGFDEIRWSAFEGCTSLKNVSLPSTIKTMEQKVFSGCTSLETVTFAEGTKLDNANLGRSIFYNCKKLKNADIIECFENYIPDATFWYCESLTDIKIPDNIETIGDSAFRDCAGIQSVTMSDSVKSIGYCAFGGCTSLTEIVIPENVEEINDEAFSDCTSLSKFNIPQKTTYVGEDIIHNTALQNSMTGPVYYCDGWAVDVDEATASVTIKAGTKGLSAYLCHDYYNPDSLKEVILPDGLLYILGSAFSGCTELKDIEIPESVIYIDVSAFSDTGIIAKQAGPLYYSGDWLIGCDDAATEAIIKEGTNHIANGSIYEVVKTSGTGATGVFDDCKSLTRVVIPDSITEIPIGAFFNCQSLTDIKIPENVDSIGAYAFWYCKQLSAINLPEGIVSIGNNTFYMCESLTDIDIPDSVTYIGNDAFYACKKLRNVVIPVGTTYIGDSAFFGCDALVSISIPVSVESIGEMALRGNSALKDIYYGGTKAQWETLMEGSLDDLSEDVVVHYNSNSKEDIKTILTGKCGDNVTFTVYSDGILHITGTGDMNYNFWTDSLWKDYTDSITNVIVDEGITSIGSYFLLGINLDTFELPSSIVTLEDNALSSYVHEITIPANVKEIGKRALSARRFEIDPSNEYFTVVDRSLYSKDMTRLVAYRAKWFGYSADIPEGVVTIDDYAFDYEVDSINLPASLKEVSSRSFDNATRCESVTVDETNPYYKSVDGILFNKDMTEIIYFPQNKSAENYTIPSGVTVIGPYALSYTMMSKIVIPDSVTSIGEDAFGSCTSLTSITIPDSVTSIGGSAFFNCKSLTSITIPDSVTSIGGYAFYYCTNLADIYFGGTESQWISLNKNLGYDKEKVTVHFAKEDTPPTREEQIDDFVERLYTIMLNRESDEGKQSHVDGLFAGATAAQISEGFVLGEELKVWNISNEEFVRRMYLTFLDREADPEGLAVWTSVLDKGCSYGRMFRDFCNSAEFKIICDSYGISQGSFEVTEPRDINENITHYCSRMYTKALGRAYDIDGLNNWAKALLDGTETPESIAVTFLDGDEFRMWNHSDEVFVDRLYETLFNRPADAEGKQTWLNLLSLGTSRKTAIETFVQSEEFKILKASLGL